MHISRMSDIVFSFLAMWRVWEELGSTSTSCMSHHTACVDLGSTFDFTVMSYNILAQDLLEANSELYAHCSEAVLAWENRLQNVLGELQTWEPDVSSSLMLMHLHYSQIVSKVVQSR